MKKIVAFVLAAMTFGTQAFAFNFPEPDWGALLREKTKMVNEVDFELYVEGPVDSAPFYGARLEPRGGAYLGMVAENADFLGSVGSYLTYFSMEIGQTDIYYPANQIIEAHNAVVTIGYTVGSLSSVNYDIIREALNNLASYNKPMFIRFANEMNVSSIGDDPTLYVDTFRRVADMIHEYPNFAVVWSPNDMGALDRPFEYYYPGDQYVDWIGVSSYMKKYFQGNQNTIEKEAIYFMTGDYAWTTNALKPIVKFMADNNINKPLMISEGGVATSNIYGEDCDAWASPRFRNMYYNVIMKYPQVKLINYFNTYRADEKEHFYVHDNHNSEAVDKTYAMYIINEAASSGAYISEYGGSPEFVYERADRGSTIAAKNGIVNFHTLAHVPKAPYLTVNYTLDGAWYHSSQAAPYTCGLDITGLADGAHTIEISSLGMSKKYTFYKSGNAVRFGGMPEYAAASEPVSQKPVTEEIKISVNGSFLTPDVPPVIINDRTLVPLRAIFEALGAEVKWNGDEKTAAANGRGNTIRLRIGDNILYKNNAAVQLDVPAQIVNDRTMVPVRAIAEAMDCMVDWIPETKTVVITG
ncbi:MAG: hypothetical protein J6N52_01805 [Clostridia bacterium]|nr:hypothetical protein [Clostridia bacterium]